MHLIRLIKGHIAPYRWHVVAVIILELIATLAVLYLPTLNARIIDHGVATGDIGYIWSTGGIMLAVALVQLLASVVAVWFSAHAAMGVGRDIRRNVSAPWIPSALKTWHNSAPPPWSRAGQTTFSRSKWSLSWR